MPVVLFCLCFGFCFGNVIKRSVRLYDVNVLTENNFWTCAVTTFISQLAEAYNAEFTFISFYCWSNFNTVRSMLDLFKYESIKVLMCELYTLYIP